MATILAQKAAVDSAVAKSDNHHDVLAADPTITQFPQGSTYGTTSTTTGFGGSSTFGLQVPLKQNQSLF